MHNIPEEAVKAAIAAHNKYYDDLVVYPSEEPTPEGAFHAALKGALPFLPVQGAVKKLEWRDGYKDSQCTIIQADTLGGFYQVRQVDGLIWLDSIGHQTIYPTLDAAKSAAQADFEARILSALEPSAARSLALEEGYRQGIEAAAQIIETKQEGFQVRGGGRVLIDRSEGDQSGLGYAAAIRALSSPDHADAGKLDAAAICKKLAPYLGATETNDWTGLKDDDAISMTVKMRVGDLRTLKAVATDEADAGKVEGHGLPQDVINLVIAAREVWEEADTLSYYHTDEEFSQRVKALDKALEAFSERVPYENEPSAPSEGAE